MYVPLTLALVLTCQLPPAAKEPGGLAPFALKRTIEIDDLEHEVQRLHDSVQQKKAHLGDSQRIVGRGAMSRADLAAEYSACRLEEAREGESAAYLALKVQERDVIDRAAPPDEAKAYELLLEWLRKQEIIAQVDVDYREYILKQSRALFQRKAIGRQDLEEDELKLMISRTSVTLSQARQGRVALERAERKGDDPAETKRARAESFQTAVRYGETVADLAHRRLDLAQDRSKRGLIPANELAIFQQGVKDADASLTEAKGKLAKPE